MLLLQFTGQRASGRGLQRQSLANLLPSALTDVAEGPSAPVCENPHRPAKEQHEITRGNGLLTHAPELGAPPPLNQAGEESHTKQGSE